MRGKTREYSGPVARAGVGGGGEGRGPEAIVFPSSRLIAERRSDMEAQEDMESM